MFPDDRCQMLVLGAGFGGLPYAVRMVALVSDLSTFVLSIVQAASVAPGTGIDTRDSCAILKVTVACRCWRRLSTYLGTCGDYSGAGEKDGC